MKFLYFLIDKKYLKKFKNDLKNKKIGRFFLDLLAFSWYGEGLLSYVLFIVLIYSFYKLILSPFIFPLFFGNSNPLNTIVSGSMEHNPKDFDKWWELYGFYYKKEFNITKEDFEKFPYKDGLYIGDFVLVKNYPKNEIKVGDIIVYYVPSLKKSIIHRVVKIKNESGKICFETMGDNNVRFVFLGYDPQGYFEKNVCNIEGKVILRIPYLGLPRYWLYKIFNI